MLRLGDEAVSFEQSNTLSEVFYDHLNTKVCTVRGNGAIGITSRALGADVPVQSIRIRDQGRINIIKFNSSGKHIALQRMDRPIDIIFIDSPASTGGGMPTEVAVQTKARNVRIKGVEWVTGKQFVIVTAQSLELFQVSEEGKRPAVKALRQVTVTIEWALYSSAAQLFMVASGPSHSLLQPILLRQGQFSRLAKFEYCNALDRTLQYQYEGFVSWSADKFCRWPQVDFGCSNSNSHVLIQNASIEVIYGRLYLRALRSSRRDASTSDIALYEVANDPSLPSKLKYVLSLGMTGLFGVHVIDNLVIVHHQSLHKSLVFDVGVSSAEITHRPLFEMELACSPHLSSLSGGPLASPALTLYAASWAVFSPDIVIDTAAGLFARLTVHVEEAEKVIQSKSTLISFLLNRNHAKKVLLSVLYESLLKKQLRLRELRSMFNEMNERLSASLSAQQLAPTTPKASTWAGEAKLASLLLPASSPSPAAPSAASRRLVPDTTIGCVVRQEELRSAVFFPLDEQRGVDSEYLANAMLEYLRSLCAFNLPAEPFLLELLVGRMIKGNEMNRLQQLLGYKVIDDSKPLAFLLISLEARHHPLFQAGLDMLLRTRSASEEIAEVLLARKQFIEALRYMGSWPVHERPISWLRLLEAAAEDENRPVRFACGHFFQLLMKGWPGQFAQLESGFRGLFDEREIEEAEGEFARGEIDWMDENNLDGMQGNGERGGSSAPEY